MIKLAWKKNLNITCT